VADFWSPDGNWSEDMQGDATAFAPLILYATPGTNEAELRRRPRPPSSTRLKIASAVAATGELSMEPVIGAPALAYGFQSTGKAIYRGSFLIGARRGYSMIAADPEAFAAYVGDLASVYATGAYISLMAYEISGEKEDLDNALDLISRANDTEWDDEQGIYRWSMTMDWPQATMIMALAKAYQATHDEALLTHARRALARMNSGCWDAAHGGYFTDETRRGKTLSGNNNMAWAALDLYEATGDASLLDRARETLTWVFTADLHSTEVPMLFHDWTPEYGRSEHFCTGCNFHTLCNVHRLNVLAAAEFAKG